MRRVIRHHAVVGRFNAIIIVLGRLVSARRAGHLEPINSRCAHAANNCGLRHAERNNSGLTGKRAFFEASIGDKISRILA